MGITTFVLVIFTATVVVFGVVYSGALHVASKNIFSGSGAPINMANVLLRSIIAAGQIIAGIAILAVISALIASDKIASEVGLPIIAALTGYLVGKNFPNEVIK